MNIVIDANVVVKWYVSEDEFTSEAEYMADERFFLHAPELIIPEIGNILWKKFIRKELTHSEVLKILSESAIEEDLTLHSHDHLFSSAVCGAMETQKTVYDWMYVSLAEALQIPFVTADKKLFNSLSSTPHGERLVWIGDVKAAL
jgi:predicted nucleic acid-binding protein